MVTEVTVNIQQVARNISLSSKNIIYRVLLIILECYQNQVKNYNFLALVALTLYSFPALW